ncbi:MAG: efflux RND transporter periplasmic adaptor subunit [Ketobacter sp.]|nr:efflux RND transporter periplasmic adaptor subunit [Ketobacter sp.]
MGLVFKWLLSLLILVSAGGFAIVSWVQTRIDQSVEVQSIAVSRGPISAHVKAAGFVDAPLSYSITAPKPARLSSLKYQVGQNVRSGETLVLLDNEQASERLRNAEAQVNVQQAQVHSAELDVRAEESIWRAGGQTRQAVDQAEAQLAASRALLEAAHSDVRSARLQLASYTVKSPADGIITKVSAHVGEFVQAGGALLTLASQDSQEIRLKVDQVWADQIQIGQLVELSIEGVADRVGKTNITRIEPKIQRDGSSYYLVAIAAMPTDDFLVKLNQQLSARILTVSRPDALRVPLDVVTEKDGVDVVRIILDGRLHLQRVQTGIQDGQQIEIIDGLSEGRQVVLANLREALDEGTRVQLIEGNR